MLIVLLFLWLIFSPFRVNAQDYTPTPTETGVPTPAETLTPTATIDSTPTPTSTPSSTTAPTNAPAASASTASTDTPTPTQKVTSKQSSTNGGGGFGGSGLVDEKESVDNGLGLGESQTLGAASSQDIDSAGDKDLLITLIFLTGAVVLVVWTVYIILVQNGMIKSDFKKNNQKDGITPQPLQ